MMNACYDVNLKIQFKDKESEDAAIHAMQNFIAEHDGSGINFSLSAYKKEGTTPDTLDGLLKIFLAGWNMCHPEIKHGRKWIRYENSFDASYSWESVMMKMFKLIAPYLADKSELYIYPDDDYDHLVVKNGKCVQVH